MPHSQFVEFTVIIKMLSLLKIFNQQSQHKQGDNVLLLNIATFAGILPYKKTVFINVYDIYEVFGICPAFPGTI